MLVTTSTSVVQTELGPKLTSRTENPSEKIRRSRYVYFLYVSFIHLMIHSFCITIKNAIQVKTPYSCISSNYLLYQSFVSENKRINSLSGCVPQTKRPSAFPCFWQLILDPNWCPYEVKLELPGLGYDQWRKVWRIYSIFQIIIGYSHLMCELRSYFNL